MAQSSDFSVYFVVIVQLDLFLHLAHQRLDLFELVPDIAEILFFFELKSIQVAIVPACIPPGAFYRLVGSGGASSFVFDHLVELSLVVCY